MGNCCKPHDPCLKSALSKASSYAAAANQYAQEAENYLTQVTNIYNDFDERYLGAKNAPPTTDNEGNPLQEGAMYWNSVTDALYVWDGSAWLALPSGFDELTNFLATGTTTARNLVTRTGEFVNVKDFGAIGDGVADDYASFVAAIAALPTDGGKIIVPSGVYNISAAPTWGAKSIYWDIDVNAVFTGTGTGYGLFPNIATNIGNIAAGPWVQSRTTQAPPYVGAAVNAATFEMIAPTSVTNGYYVALYAGGAGNAPSATNDVWASNFVIEANPGSLGAYFGLEVDVISQSLNAITRGILISGHGNFDADVALEIDRNLVIGTGEWYYGITTKAVKNAIQIFADASLEKGISIGTAYTSDFQRSLFSGKQLDNVVGNAAVVLQRNTDTLPVGDLIRCVNAANTDIIFNVDASGNVGCDGFFISQNDIKTHSGAMIIADSTGAITYFDARSTGILAPNLPTSSIGLPAGSLWVDTTAGNVVKRV